MTTTGLDYIILEDFTTTDATYITNLDATGSLDIENLTTNYINPGVASALDIQGGLLVINNPDVRFGGAVNVPSIKPVTGNDFNIGTSQFEFNTDTGILDIPGSVDNSGNLNTVDLVVTSGSIDIGADLTCGELVLTDYESLYMNVSKTAVPVASVTYVTLPGIASVDNSTFSYAADTLTINRPGYYMTSVFVQNFVLEMGTAVDESLGFRIFSPSLAKSMCAWMYGDQTMAAADIMCRFTICSSFFALPGTTLQVQAYAEDGATMMDSYYWTIVKMR